MELIHHAFALPTVKRFARVVHAQRPDEVIWCELEKSLTEVFGQRLFTVLAYDEVSSRLGRLHTNRPEINPVGGVKRVTQSRWAEQVLRRGEMYRGSTREDIKGVFSEYELLWSIGCESVLNIPVRKGGLTLGTLNLLGEAGLYDHADIDLAVVFAQLAVVPMEASAHKLREFGEPDQMEQV